MNQSRHRVLIESDANQDSDKCARRDIVSGEHEIGSPSPEIGIDLRSYYGVILPCILNLISMSGFCILNSILGGQTLASVSDGNLSWRWGHSRFNRYEPTAYNGHVDVVWA